jgi:hypothetical protein
LTASEQKYLTTEDLAERFRTVPSTIRYWRGHDYGPKGIVVGRRILYPIEHVEAFERELRQPAGAA